MDEDWAGVFDYEDGEPGDLGAWCRRTLASKGTGRGRRGTEILDEDFLPCHDLLVLANERFPILQDLLLLGIEDAQSIGIHAACLLGQRNFDILYGGLVCDVDARG
jgi:hypothetical protein